MIFFLTIQAAECPLANILYTLARVSMLRICCFKSAIVSVYGVHGCSIIRVPWVVDSRCAIPTRRRHSHPYSRTVCYLWLSEFITQTMFLATSQVAMAGIMMLVFTTTPPSLSLGSRPFGPSGDFLRASPAKAGLLQWVSNIYALYTICNAWRGPLCVCICMWRVSSLNNLHAGLPVIDWSILQPF